MKPIQILTDESIEKIKSAITTLEAYNHSYPSDVADQSIKELNGILTDINEK